MIGPFRGEYQWLSNFWPVEVVLDGEVYPSVEHAYQAAKTQDPIVRHMIRTLSAAEARRFGRRVSLRPYWDRMKVSVMRDLLRQKFQHPELKKKLLATGDEILRNVNNWGDTFWGTDENGVGENWLGALLMQVRHELRSTRRQVGTVCFTGHRPDKLGGYYYYGPNPTADLVKEKLEWAIRGAIMHNGTRCFITGMAQGVDQWAAELVRDIRAELCESECWAGIGEEIKLIAAIPFAAQAGPWPFSEKQHWARLLKACDEIWVQSDDGKSWHLWDQYQYDDFINYMCKRGYSFHWALGCKCPRWPKFTGDYKRLFQQRNQWMVDRADAVLAVWDGSPGGTANCVNYARKVGKPITIIDPRTGSVRKES